MLRFRQFGNSEIEIKANYAATRAHKINEEFFEFRSKLSLTPVVKKGHEKK